MKHLFIILLASLSFSAFAENRSENADLYVEGRYGSLANNPMYDHQKGERGANAGTSVSVSDGPVDKNHDVYRFESLMGGH